MIHSPPTGPAQLRTVKKEGVNKVMFIIVYVTIVTSKHCRVVYSTVVINQ